MQRYLEFHDSTMLDIVQAGTSIQIALDAYVHCWNNSDGIWKGEGWAYSVQIKMESSQDSTITAHSNDLDGGRILTFNEVISNLVPLPWNSLAASTLRLEFKSGEVVDIVGKDIRIDIDGEGKFVEDLPEEFNPKNFDIAQ